MNTCSFRKLIKKLYTYIFIDQYKNMQLRLSSNSNIIIPTPQFLSLYWPPTFDSRKLLELSKIDINLPFLIDSIYDNIII